MTQSSPPPSADDGSPTPPLAAEQAYAKVFAERCELPIRDFITIFHAWVKTQRTGELLIDVHDYSHVHDGPGVILVGHSCHYGIDRRAGRLGLVFRARRTPAQPVATALAAAVRALVNAASLLEEDAGGGLSFARGELLVGFEDRLHAPNRLETFEAFRPELNRLATRLLGQEAIVERVGADRDLFGATLRGEPVSLADLAATLD